MFKLKLAKSGIDWGYGGLSRRIGLRESHPTLVSFGGDWGRMMIVNSDRQIAQWVEQTPFVDTHEHLVEESSRLSGEPHARFPCQDWTNLFGYAADDLVASGMPASNLSKFRGPDLCSEAKYE